MTRNRIYSRKVFYFLLYRRRYFLLASELIQCQRRPEIRLRSQDSRASISEKLHHCQRSKIKSDLHDTSLQSSPKINRMLITRPLSYNESLQNPTIAILLIKICFFDHSVVFTCSKVMDHFMRQNSWTDKFRKRFKFNLS